MVGAPDECGVTLVGFGGQGGVPEGHFGAEAELCGHDRSWDLSDELA